jgi:hypothetical protein
MSAVGLAGKGHVLREVEGPQRSVTITKPYGAGRGGPGPCERGLDPDHGTSRRGSHAEHAALLRRSQGLHGAPALSRIQVVSFSPPATVRSAQDSRQESNMFRRIPWQDVCKFLAGAFFVSAGVLFYLYLARVSVPLLGTGFIETPEVSGLRSIVHAVLFVTFFYLGFIRKWKSCSIN